MPLSIAQQESKEKRRVNRRTNRPHLTDRSAKQLARRLINENAITSMTVNVIETLAIAGALTTVQLQRIAGASFRTLQRLHFDRRREMGHFVDHVWASDTLVDVGFRKSNSLKALRVWKLGTLGKAIAIERGLSPVTYDSSYRMKQITHDVCCAEITSRLFLHAARHGWQGDWLNKNEARIPAIKQSKQNKGRQGLEPDAMLKFYRDDERLDFCIEFHNEYESRRAIEKVGRYEEFAGAQRYQNWDGMDEMPYLLIGYRENLIFTAYIDEIKSRIGGLNVEYVFVEPMGVWVNDDEGVPKLSMLTAGGVMKTLPDLFV